MQTKEITALFREKGLKATPQRVAVYRFLLENPIHPDVETVYKEVVRENPSFSKTTVYNCLEALTGRGLLIPVKIDSDRIRYDADTRFHGHFICEECGKIYDFECQSGFAKGIDGFEIRQKDVYYSGVCSCCRNKLN